MTFTTEKLGQELLILRCRSGMGNSLYSLTGQRSGQLGRIQEGEGVKALNVHRCQLIRLSSFMRAFEVPPHPGDQLSCADSDLSDSRSTDDVHCHVTNTPHALQASSTIPSVCLSVCLSVCGLGKIWYTCTS